MYILKTRWKWPQRSTKPLRTIEPIPHKVENSSHGIFGGTPLTNNIEFRLNECSIGVLVSMAEFFAFRLRGQAHEFATDDVEINIIICYLLWLLVHIIDDMNNSSRGILMTVLSHFFFFWFWTHCAKVLIELAIWLFSFRLIYPNMLYVCVAHGLWNVSWYHIII